MHKNDFWKFLIINHDFRPKIPKNWILFKRPQQFEHIRDYRSKKPLRRGFNPISVNTYSSFNFLHYK